MTTAIEAVKAELQQAEEAYKAACDAYEKAGLALEVEQRKTLRRYEIRAEKALRVDQLTKALKALEGDQS